MTLTKFGEIVTIHLGSHSPEEDRAVIEEYGYGRKS